jgi:hypothetical protein
VINWHIYDKCEHQLILRNWQNAEKRTSRLLPDEPEIELDIPLFFPLGHGVCTFSNTSLHRSVLDVSTSDDSRGRSGHECIVVGFTTTYPISGYHHWCCEVESRSRWGVQHYVIKFVSDLRQVGGFLRVLRFPSPIKLTATI